MLNDKVIETLYEQYTHKYGSKVDVGGNNDIDKSALVKELKKKKQEEANLITVIANGKLEEVVLNAISSRLNIVPAETKALETQIGKFNKPQQYRILTYDYFKQLCHNGSRLLTHSSLAEKRTFVEKCIEYVTLDPVRKQCNLTLGLIFSNSRFDYFTCNKRVYLKIKLSAKIFMLQLTYNS